ncbi:hypothetical protein N7532_005145 [Penicillium argentinense]|uniref:DNA-directed RNA polymerase III RPC4 n=1 Tax=Penicillium argentinense TaxID=1131581 RepID=A0A9W9K9K0_9EURO|nr:uncharacterized protein N7532_005145 [Penicillium argentinense]KAJ5098144.1 hypothetical protein N7532_005145 [Penicillium argentinense]
MPPKSSVRRAPARRTEQAEGSASVSTPQNAPAEGSRATPGQSATPGPAGRQPVQRLQSLKKRESSGSIAPTGRPASNIPGEPTKPVLKYQPKKGVQRRSKEERDAISKLEQERNNERLREAAAIQRGRGGGRGRGAFRGRGGPTGGSFGGPLGGARRGRGGGSTFGPRSFDRSQTRSVFSAGGSRPPMDYDSDDDEDSGIRISIDQIGLSDSDEDLPDDGKGKGKLPARQDPDLKGLKPVRVHRIEHEDRVVSVNMESSTARTDELRKKAEQEAKIAQGQEITPEQQDEPRVKDEPVDDDDTPMADVAPVEDDGLLPKQRMRVRRKTSDPQSSPTKPKAKAPEPQKVKRDPRELLRTKEEIDEYDRHMEDLAHVRELFREEEEDTSPETQSAERQTVESTTEGEADGSSTEKEGGERQGDNDQMETDEQNESKEDKTAKNLLGQLFLMQFPPMTPNLSIPGSEPNNSAPTDSTPAAATNQNENGSEVKPEGGDIEVTDVDAMPPTETPKVITATTDWSLPAGKVGKLNVHKSGRITMDWGGISFELDRAAMVDFVQEALIVSSSNDDPDVKPEEAADEDNRVWSMGQLCGKFTVMPNWDDML